MWFKERIIKDRPAGDAGDDAREGDAGGDAIDEAGGEARGGTGGDVTGDPKGEAGSTSPDDDKIGSMALAISASVGFNDLRGYTGLFAPINLFR